MGEIDGRLKVAGGDRGNQARSRRRSSVHGDDGMVRGKGKGGGGGRREEDGASGELGFSPPQPYSSLVGPPVDPSISHWLGLQPVGGQWARTVPPPSLSAITW